MSDVPLGAFLSGGLDSSLIVALARRAMGRPIHTFSVGLAGSRDLEAARLVADHVGTIHHEYELTVDEVMAKLPDIIRHLESYDRDLVRSAIPCYFTSRLAAQNVKVILTGEGADELFAGYTYYKDMPNLDDVLHRELRRSVSSLHNVNLQRVDRLTMAHSIEGRVPFLDLEMIELGQEIPAALKLKGDPPVEKWILRQAFDDLLPREIVWREKEQFDEGSGTVDLLKAALRGRLSDQSTTAYARANAEAGLRCAEECYYHQVFMDVLNKPERIARNVARWADRPDWTDLGMNRQSKQGASTWPQ
jgi:asparagine synthase (glutamine-hydrolysing)